MLRRLTHPVAQTGAAELRESIVGNLRRLLWTSQGSVPATLDFGLPELGVAIHGGETRAFLAALQKTIEKYEPRLHSVRVEVAPIEESGNLKIAISGEVRVGRDRRTTTFSATIEPSRRITIS